MYTCSLLYVPRGATPLLRISGNPCLHSRVSKSSYEGIVLRLEHLYVLRGATPLLRMLTFVCTTRGNTSFAHLGQPLLAFSSKQDIIWRYCPQARSLVCTTRGNTSFAHHGQSSACILEEARNHMKVVSLGSNKMCGEAGVRLYLIKSSRSCA